MVAICLGLNELNHTMDICSYISRQGRDKITQPFPNFNGYTVEDFEWISNFITLFAGYVITFLCWN